jgi:putative hydrolase of the HAD superfamily
VSGSWPTTETHHSESWWQAEGSLDGVIRQWEPLAAIEADHGLPPSTINAVAFEPGRFQAAITGQSSDEEWRLAIQLELSSRFKVDGAAVVTAWSAPSGSVDVDVLTAVRRIRKRCTVALLSNATSRLPVDLARVGLVDEIDHRFNTSDLGVAKPDPTVFEIVRETLGLTADNCLCVDASAQNVEAATSYGMRGDPYTTPANLKAFLSRDS